MSKWKPAMRGFLWESTPAQIYLTYSSVTQSVLHLSKCTDNTEQCDAVSILEESDAIQRDLDWLEKLACANLMRFNKAKWKVLQWNCQYQSRLRHEWVENTPEEKHLGILVDEELDMCPCIPESHLCPGLQQEQHRWKVEGGDFLPLEKGHKNDQRTEAPHIRKQDRSGGVVQSGEEEAPEKLIAAFQFLNKPVEKLYRDFLPGLVVTEQETWL